MKGVVLAAGEGTRFWPLTENRPKPMLPVANKPLLEHVVESLAEAGIEDIVFVVGYKRERIQNHFENGDDWGVDISYVTQDVPHGTGDALLQAESHVGESCLVLNGDRIVEADLLDRLRETHEETGEYCTAVTRVDDPTQYGMVTLDGEYITDIVEKPPEYAVTSNVVNAGVYAFGPEIFAAVRRTDSRGELALTRTIADHLGDHPVRAVHYDGLWLELTQPWDLLTANDGLLSVTGTRIHDRAQLGDDTTAGRPVTLDADTRLQPGARVLRASAIGENVRIGANSVITNSVVLPDATIGPGCLLEDSIVGENAHVGPNVTVEGGQSDVVLRDELYPDIRFGGLVGDDARLGGNVTLAPGTIIGNGTRVASGCDLSGVVDSGSVVTRG